VLPIKSAEETRHRACDRAGNLIFSPLARSWIWHLGPRIPPQRLP